MTRSSSLCELIIKKTGIPKAIIDTHIIPYYLDFIQLPSGYSFPEDKEIKLAVLPRITNEIFPKDVLRDMAVRGLLKPYGIDQYNIEEHLRLLHAVNALSEVPIPYDILNTMNNSSLEKRILAKKTYDNFFQALKKTRLNTINKPIDRIVSRAEAILHKESKENKHEVIVEISEEKDWITLSELYLAVYNLHLELDSSEDRSLSPKDKKDFLALFTGISMTTLYALNFRNGISYNFKFLQPLNQHYPFYLFSILNQGYISYQQYNFFHFSNVWKRKAYYSIQVPMQGNDCYNYGSAWFDKSFCICILFTPLIGCAIAMQSLSENNIAAIGGVLCLYYIHINTIWNLIDNLNTLNEEGRWILPRNQSSWLTGFCMFIFVGGGFAEALSFLIDADASSLLAGFVLGMTGVYSLMDRKANYHLSRETANGLFEAVDYLKNPRKKLATKNFECPESSSGFGMRTALRILSAVYQGLFIHRVSGNAWLALLVAGRDYIYSAWPSVLRTNRRSPSFDRSRFGFFQSEHLSEVIMAEPDRVVIHY